MADDPAIGETGGGKADVEIVEQNDPAERHHDRGRNDREMRGDHRPGDDRAHRPLQRPAERSARSIDVPTTVPASSCGEWAKVRGHLWDDDGADDLAHAPGDRRLQAIGELLAGGMCG